MSVELKPKILFKIDHHRDLLRQIDRERRRRRRQEKQHRAQQMRDCAHKVNKKLKFHTT